MYILLIILLLFLLMFSYIGFNREIFCPPILVTLMFLLCAIFGLFQYNNWRMSEYSFKGVLFIWLGVLSFTLFGALGYVFSFDNGYINHNSIIKDRIDLSKGFYFISIVLGLFSIITFFLYIRGIIASFGMNPNNISRFLLNYYQIKVYNTDVAPTGITKYLGFFLNVSACLSLYVFLFNFCFRHFKKKDLWLLFIVGLWIIHCILDSSRGTIMLILAEGIICIYFFENMYYGWGNGVDGKIIGIGIRLFVIMLILFTLLTVFMGRRDSFSELNLSEYLTRYISAGIRNFDIYINNPTRSDIFGKETFYSINRFLYNHFGIGEIYSNNLEYAYIGSLRNGNIYTAFRRFYADFGILGLIMLPGLMGFFYTYAYKKIRGGLMYGNIGFGLLLFAYLSSELFFMPIEERFFTIDFSMNGLFKIILLYILYILFIKKNIRFIIRK